MRMNRACLVFAMFVASFFLFAVPSFAEVCDKVVGEDWMPKDGPVSLSTPFSNLIWLVLVFL